MVQKLKKYSKNINSHIENQRKKICQKSKKNKKTIEKKADFFAAPWFSNVFRIFPYVSNPTPHNLVLSIIIIIIIIVIIIIIIILLFLLLLLSIG